MLPNFFIAGAQKSGTTSLHHLLAAHPQIFFPRRPQELHFFDLEENYALGLEWYEGHFAEWNGEPIAAQTSPYYFYHPSVPARIRSVAPEARIAVILRNPIDRAYAHYWHEVRKGWETLSFEEALKREPERIAKDETNQRHYSYVDRGRYATQLRRYLEYFPVERLYLTLTERLNEDAGALVKDLARFLQVDPEALPRITDDLSRKNTAKIPRVRTIQALRRHLVRVHPRLARAWDWLNLRPGSYPPMATATRARVAQELRSEIEDLADLTGLPVRHWYEDSW